MIFLQVLSLPQRTSLRSTWRWWTRLTKRRMTWRQSSPRERSWRACQRPRWAAQIETRWKRWNNMLTKGLPWGETEGDEGAVGKHNDHRKEKARRSEGETIQFQACTDILSCRTTQETGIHLQKSARPFRLKWQRPRSRLTMWRRWKTCSFALLLFFQRNFIQLYAMSQAKDDHKERVDRATEIKNQINKTFAAVLDANAVLQVSRQTPLRVILTKWAGSCRRRHQVPIEPGGWGPEGSNQGKNRNCVNLRSLEMVIRVEGAYLCRRGPMRPTWNNLKMLVFGEGWFQLVGLWLVEDGHHVVSIPRWQHNYEPIFFGKFAVRADSTFYATLIWCLHFCQKLCMAAFRNNCCRHCNMSSPINNFELMEDLLGFNIV